MIANPRPIDKLRTVMQGPDGQWVHKVVIKGEWPKMIGWALPTLPPLITDILISLDDKYLYFSNW